MHPGCVYEGREPNIFPRGKQAAGADKAWLLDRLRCANREVDVEDGQS
jgi:hypothetical protein